MKRKFVENLVSSSFNSPNFSLGIWITNFWFCETLLLYRIVKEERKRDILNLNVVQGSDNSLSDVLRICLRVQMKYSILLNKWWQRVSWKLVVLYAETSSILA